MGKEIKGKETFNIGVNQWVKVIWGKVPWGKVKKGKETFDRGVNQWDKEIWSTVIGFFLKILLNLHVLNVLLFFSYNLGVYYKKNIKTYRYISFYFSVSQFFQSCCVR